MTREKVNIQWIANTLSRRATYKRRCKRLMKKASELATLCGVKVSVVVYGEDKVQPEVWPTDLEARRLLNSYKDMPEVGNFKKSLNQVDFLKGRITKLRGQVQKSESENYKRKTLDLLHDRMNGHHLRLFGASTKELTSLDNILDEISSKAKERLGQLGVGQGEPMEPQLQLLQGSSSSQQPQDPNPCTEMQTLALEEEAHPQQQDQNRLLNSGELGTLPSNAFLGTSSGCTGPSSSGVDMVQPYTPGCYSASPWTWEWDPFFPNME